MLWYTYLRPYFNDKHKMSMNYLLAKMMNPNTAGKELEGSLEIVVCDFQGSNSELQVYLHFCWRPHLSHSGLGNKIFPTEIKWRLHLQNHQQRQKLPRSNIWGWKIFGPQRKRRTEKENKKKVCLSFHTPSLCQN